MEKERERENMAWGSAFIGVDGGCLGFHRLTVSEFKT